MHATIIERDLAVPMRDGTVLRADVYRPAKEGTFPVLVYRTPYNKLFRFDAYFDLQVAVDREFVFVAQDTRGRFASEGEWMPFAHEREDGYDTIEWAAALPYSNGKVGTIGLSYCGSTQWSSAIMQAPHLRAIAPVVTWADPDDGLMFRDGVLEHGGNVSWSLAQSLTQHPKEALPPEQMFGKIMATVAEIDQIATRGYWALPSGRSPALAHTGQPSMIGRAIADPATMDDCRVSNRYDDVEVPCLNIGGWYDIFLQGSIDNYVAMRKQGQIARLVVGPWAHVSLHSTTPNFVGDVNFGLGSIAPFGRSLTDMQLDWYEHWLRDAPSTAAHESGVAIFVMGINQWRLEADWPLERAKSTAMYLHANGSLTWDRPSGGATESTYVYDPSDPTPTCGGGLVMSGEYPAGPLDQATVEARPDVLTFTSEPLDRDVEVTGRLQAIIFAGSDGPSTDFVVRLCCVDAHGVSRNIADGIARIQTDPSQICEVDVDLWSTSIVFAAGERIRVQVTSSNFPRWDRNPNTGEPARDAEKFRVARQRILHDAAYPSRIILPIIPGGDTHPTET